ncbi:MAG: imidazolonepropionase [Bdellovibrionales bacterium]|nr:imidazolonepropionase [Bdellovibrionales bacterium]
MKTKVFFNIAELLTMAGGLKKKGRLTKVEDLGLVRKAALIVQQGRVLWVGSQNQLPRSLKKLSIQSRNIHEIDLDQQMVLPGFVECHTHLLFAGDRRDDFEKRNQGIKYQQIAQEGGGIQSTVRATRKASLQSLFQSAQGRVHEFVRQGVTTLEVKSGYGLDFKNEMKLLKAATKLSGPRVVSTFLGPHALPPEFKTHDDYLDELIHKVLPVVAKKKWAQRLDIFVEPGYFSGEHLKKWAQAAHACGMDLVAHVDQLSTSGGSVLAVRLGAKSLDHAVHLNAEEIITVARSEATVVLLPSADFYLQESYPEARKLIEQGARVALATDFNPGTSPTQDLSFIGVLARLQMKMSLAEVLMAYTLNGAWALGLENEVGVLAPGYQCDFLCLTGDWRDLFYQVGYHPVAQVYRQGTRIFRKHAN